jgi:N-methylhydantoinase A
MTGALDHAHTLQMRFVGQAFEVDVPLSAAELESLTTAALALRFEEANRRMYLHSEGAGLAGRKVEIVGFRAGSTAAEKCVLPPRPPAGAARTVRRTPIHENREARTCAVTTRALVRIQGGADGPLLVEDETSTIYVPPGWHATEDAAGNLVLSHMKVKE